MGLSLVMGLGVAAGMSANREVKAANALNPTEYKFVYLTDPGWSQVCVHNWGVSGDRTSWSDYEPAWLAQNDNGFGQKVYKTRIDLANYEKLIFNDHGSNQTSDLDFSTNYKDYDGVYKDGSTWKGFNFSATYSVTGNGSFIAGDFANDIDLTGDDSSATIVLTLEAGDKLKIRENHQWGTSYGFSSLEGTSASSFEADGDGNIVLSSGKDGTYKFTFEAFDAFDGKCISVEKLTTASVNVYVNGVQRGTSPETIAIGALPADPEYYGVNFDGKWYTDSAMQNECTGVTATTTALYCATTTAADVTFTLDATRATDKFADTYLYTWFEGHDPKTAWPGDKFTTSTFTVKAGSKFIINAGQGKEQTVDVTPSIVSNDTLRILNSTDGEGHYNVKWASEVESYKYSINGGTEIPLQEEDDEQFASLTTVELHKGDVITFTKNDAPYAVTPKDDDQFTNVYLNGDDELVAARDCNEKFYLNVVTNKLWNGEFPSGFYLLGDNNGWNVKTGLAASQEGESDTYYVENVTLAAGQGIKMTYVNSDAKDVTYYNADASKVISSTGVAYSVDDTDHNLIATNAGTYNIYYNTASTYYSIEDTVAPTYKVSVNGVAQELPTHEGTEYSTAALTLTAGQEIKVLRNDVVDTSFTLKQSRNNNVRSNGTVLVDATNAHIYVDTSDKTIFVEGVPFGGYHIIRNDHELITMTHGSEYEGYDQYYSDMVSFSVNDKIKFVNTNDQYDEHETRIPGLPDEFSISIINPGDNGPKFAVDGEYIKCTTAVQTKVYLKLKYHLDEVYFGTVDQFITDAITFGQNFCTAIESACENVEDAKTTEELATARTALENAWAAQVTAFNALSEEARNYLKSQAAHSVHELDDFFAKYDRVYTYRGITHGWTLFNFLQTEYNSNAYINPIMINKANSVVMVSIIVSMVTLFASAGVVLFLFKKKKHN